MGRIKAIIFDFDGVILESMDVKTKAFAFLFRDWPEQVKKIIDLHKLHGGLSRFEKFEIIYRDFLKLPLSQEKKEELGRQFSEYVYQEVLRVPFVAGAREFLEKNYKKLPLFIASGTPQEELRSLVKDRGLAKYFQGVYGAPLKKKDLILNILKEFNFKNSEVIMVGDSIDDQEGAKGAGVGFILRTKENNPFPELEKIIGKRTLVFVEDEVDLKVLSKNKDNDFSVICCNYHLLEATQTMFPDAKYLFDLLEVRDAQYSAYQEATEAALLFWEKVKEGSCAPLHYSLLGNLRDIFYYILFSESLINQVLEKTRANSVLLLPRREFPVTLYGTRRFGSKSGIFSAVLEKLCSERKDLQVKKNSWLFGLLAAPRLIFQFLPIFFFFKLFGKGEFHQKPGRKPAQEAVFINWGVDLRKHTNLADLSAELASYPGKIIHLLWEKEKTPVLPKNQQIFYKKHLVFYLFRRGVFTVGREFSKGLSECFSALEGKFYSREFFFAYFYLYLYGTGIIEGYRKYFASLFNKFSPKLLLTSDIPNHLGRAFVFTARQYGAKACTFSHGCVLHMPWLDPSGVLGDKILVSGQGVGLNFQKSGIDQERTVIVGGGKKTVSSSVGEKDKKTIAIITSMKIGNWLEPRDLFRFFRAIEDLTVLLLELGFKVLIKSHKLADYWEFYDQLVASYKNYPIEHVRERWSKEQLSSLGAAIFPGSITSTILDCQAAGVPVIYVDVLSRIEKEILRYDYQGCGAVVGNTKEALEAIQRLSSDKNYLEDVLSQGRQFYKNHVNMDKDFTEELAKIICSKS